MPELNTPGQAKAKAKTVGDYLQTAAFQKHLERILPRQLNSERFMTIALRQLNQVPNLALCSLPTVAGGIMECAILGLEIATMGEAWLIPFENKRQIDGEWTKVWEAELQIGYLGYLSLAWRSEQMKGLDVGAVCEGDDFEFEKGSNAYVRFVPMAGQGDVTAANLTYVYACVQTIYGGTVLDVWDRTHIERIRNVGHSANSPAWRNFYPEMSVAKVLKSVLKFAPKSRELARAITLGDEADAGVRQSFSVDIHGALPELPESFGGQTVDDLKREAAEAQEAEGSADPEGREPVPVEVLKSTQQPADKERAVGDDLGW